MGACVYAWRTSISLAYSAGHAQSNCIRVASLTRCRTAGMVEVAIGSAELHIARLRIVKAVCGQQLAITIRSLPVASIACRALHSGTC